MLKFLRSRRAITKAATAIIIVLILVFIVLAILGYWNFLYGTPPPE